MDYGAKDDTTIDARASFVSALAAVNDSGGVVFLPAGDFALSDSILILKPNVTIKGVSGKSRIYLKSSTARFRVGAIGATFEDLTFFSEETGYVVGAIYSEGLDRVTVRNCSFRGGGNAIRFHSVDDFRIENVYVDSLTGRTNPISLYNCNGGIVEGVMIRDYTAVAGSSSPSGLVVQNSQRVQINGGQIENIDFGNCVTGSGISIYNSSLCTITGTVIYGLTNGDGIVTQAGSHDITISGVSSTNNAGGSGTYSANGDGIDLFNSWNIEVTGCNLRDNDTSGTSHSGMEIWGCQNVAVSNVDASNSGTNGFEIINSPFVSLVNCVSNGNDLNGVNQNVSGATVTTTGIGVKRTAGGTFGLGWQRNALIYINSVEYLVDTVYSADSLDLQTSAGSQSGVAAQVPCYELKVIGGTYNDNNEDDNANVWQQCGIYLGCRGTAILSGVTATDTDTTDGKLQKYGFYVADANGAPQVYGCEFAGNATAEYGDVGSGLIGMWMPGYVLPAGDGSAGQGLVTDGSGSVTFGTVGGSGETNTLADTGTFDNTSGFGLVTTKVGTELRMRGVMEGSNITMALSGDTGLVITSSGSTDSALVAQYAHVSDSIADIDLGDLGNVSESGEAQNKPLVGIIGGAWAPDNVDWDYVTVSNEIDSTDLGENCVLGAELGPQVVTSAHIYPGTITTNNLANGAKIDSAEIGQKIIAVNNASPATVVGAIQIDTTAADRSVEITYGTAESEYIALEDAGSLRGQMGDSSRAAVGDSLPYYTLLANLGGIIDTSDAAYADSAGILDTTGTGFQTYVANHAGGAGWNLADSMSQIEELIEDSLNEYSLTTAIIALIADSLDEYSLTTAIRALIGDSLDEYSLTTAIAAAYETIAEVAKIGDDTTHFKTAYDSSQHDYLRSDETASDVDSSGTEIAAALNAHDDLYDNFSELGGTVSDAQVPNDITVDSATQSIYADTADVALVSQGENYEVFDDLIAHGNLIHNNRGHRLNLDNAWSPQKYINDGVKLHLPFYHGDTLYRTCLDRTHYNDSNMIVHTGAAYSQKPYHGWHFWMATTPYGPGPQYAKWETVNLYVSNNGVYWTPFIEIDSIIIAPVDTFIVDTLPQICADDGGPFDYYDTLRPSMAWLPYRIDGDYDSTFMAWIFGDTLQAPLADARDTDTYGDTTGYGTADPDEAFSDADILFTGDGIPAVIYRFPYAKSYCNGRDTVALWTDDDTAITFTARWRDTSGVYDSFQVASATGEAYADVVTRIKDSINAQSWWGVDSCTTGSADFAPCDGGTAASRTVLCIKYATSLFSHKEATKNGTVVQFDWSPRPGSYCMQRRMSPVGDEQFDIRLLKPTVPDSMAFYSTWSETIIIPKDSIALGVSPSIRLDSSGSYEMWMMENDNSGGDDIAFFPTTSVIIKWESAYLDSGWHPATADEALHPQVSRAYMVDTLGYGNGLDTMRTIPGLCTMHFRDSTFGGMYVDGSDTARMKIWHWETIDYALDNIVGLVTMTIDGQAGDTTFQALANSFDGGFTWVFQPSPIIQPNLSTSEHLRRVYRSSAVCMYDGTQWYLEGFFPFWDVAGVPALYGGQIYFNAIDTTDIGLITYAEAMAEALVGDSLVEVRDTIGTLDTAITALQDEDTTLVVVPFMFVHGKDHASADSIRLGLEQWSLADTNVIASLGRDSSWESGAIDTFVLSAPSLPTGSYEIYQLKVTYRTSSSTGTDSKFTGLRLIGPDVSSSSVTTDSTWYKSGVLDLSSTTALRYQVSLSYTVDDEYPFALMLLSECDAGHWVEVERAYMTVRVSQ